jgi:8-hydroxy-5-deazaflavin:NADPH oxidoreductase
MAEHVAAISGARVVKAFNMCDATVWAAPPQPSSSGRLSVMFAAGDDGAGEVVTSLITDLGHRAVPVGGLDRARYLEAAAALVISLLSHGEPPGPVLNWTHVGQLAAPGNGEEVSS